MDRF
ncbi:hypothetical protein YPPY66_4907, partial [Yersinia pestis PY-66]|jgi:hypothetical protein